MEHGLDARTRRELRSLLEAREGIRRVLVDDEEGTLWLVCDPDGNHQPLGMAVRNILPTLGVDPEAYRIEFAVAGERGQRRRVRFESVECLDSGRPTGGSRMRVTLEWKGSRHVGTAEGEVGGRPMELRAAAYAAIAALEDLIGRDLKLRVIGIKQMRAFDEDLMVASLYTSAPSPRHFVGTVLVSGDPLRAAVLSVLNALNRLLGNYLSTTD